MKAKLKRRKNRLPYFLAIAITLLAVPLLCASCSEQPPAPPVGSPALPVKPKATTKEESEAEKGKSATGDTKSAQEEYTYNPDGKLDPFMPLFVSMPTGKEDTAQTPAKKEIPLTPLQKLDVGDFNLVAVIVTPKGLTALLEDQSKNGFIVKEGLLIGRNEGVIKKILSNSIIIEENAVDLQGNIEKKPITLTLKKK